MPNATMTIAGKLASAGSANFTARGAVNVSGDVELGGTSNFNGGSFTHTIGGNWTDNATFNGNTSTVVLNGANKQIRRTASGSANFNNLTVSGAGLSIPAAAVTVSGNLTTSGAGAITHSHSNGSLTMSGSNTSISGSDIKLNNLISDGSVTTASNIEVTGSISVNAGKSFTASSGTIWLSGTGKNITAPGTLTFSGLRVTGTVNTASSFSINGDLSGNGTITATANTVTFNGTSTYGGRHNLFNVTVPSGRSLTMAADANLAVAGSLATPGTLNVTTNTPNTVTYNGTAAQTVLGRAYHNIEFDRGGAKTANGALTVNGNLTINAGSNFSAGSFNHKISRNWANNGSFAHQNGSIELVGSGISNLSGASTVFNQLTINKSTANNTVTQSSDITAATLNMTRGTLNTGSNRVTITGNRTGDGWVVGTIRRAHTIAANTPYAFNSPFTQVSFATVSNVSDISSTLTLGAISNFPSGAALNRRINIAIPSGTYTGATLKIQYLDSELNGSLEDALQLYRTIGTAWESAGKNDNSSTENWVSQGGLASITGQWAISAETSVYSWRGGTSTNWNVASNWFNLSTGQTAASVPGETDIVELGDVAPTRQPTINSNVTVKGLQFISNAPITLTLGTGNLTVASNLSTAGNGSISNHTINLGSRTLHVGGDMTLNHGAANAINLNLGSGTALVGGDLNQTGNARIDLGSGNFRLMGDYNMSANVANFVRSTGTFTYEGPDPQLIGEVYYNNLTIDKSAGIARLRAAQTGYVAGTITIKQGELSVPGGVYDFQGDIVQEGGVFSVGTSDITVRKSWTKTGGEFNGETSKVTFTGNLPQAIPAATFNNIIIDKGAASGISLAGNVTVNADLEVKSGTLRLDDYTLNRSAAGGRFTMGGAAVLELNGSNFPANFNNVQLDKSSTVAYKGTAEQNIAGVTYGNLHLQNGAANAKKLSAATSVAGDLRIANGAMLNGDGQTLTLRGNFYQQGTFVAGPTFDTEPYATGTLVLAANGGGTKELAGTFSVNNMLIESGADYKLSAGGLLAKGNFTNQGTIDFAGFNATAEGDFLNAAGATIKISGTAAFSGTRLQTIQLQGDLVASGAIPPAVEFNGSVAPVLNSTEAPNFGSLKITNTGGIKASVGWTTNLGFTVTEGATFDGGTYTHNFHTSIQNAGTIRSTGVLNFEPKNLGLPLSAYTLNFGATAESFQSTGTLQIAGDQKVALLGVVPDTLYRLVLTNTHADGVSLATLTGNEIQVYDDLIIGEGAILHGGTKSYTLHGNLTNNGLVQAEGADVTFTSAKETPGQGAVPAVFGGIGTASFKNFTVAEAANLILSQEIVNVYGNFAHNGASFDGSQGELKFKGSEPAFITAAGNQEVNIQHVHITKENGATVTLQTPLRGVTNFMVETGVFDAGDQAIATTEDSEETNSPLLQIREGATYRLSGAKMPEYRVHEFAPTSTVEYYGTNQTIESVQYGNLRLMNAGQKTFEPGTAKIAGHVTLATDVTVITPDTIAYNGSGSQVVAPVNYNNLTLSNGGTKTLAAGTTGIAKSLTLSDGAGIAATGTGVTVSYNGTDPQHVLPTNYFNLMLSNGSAKHFSETTGIANTFSLQDGATADLTAENTIVFNGNGPQPVPALAYYNLTSAGAGIKTLGGDASVVNALTLTAGEIRTGSNAITLGEEGRITETETAFVTGTVKTQRTLTATREDFGGLGLAITPTGGSPGPTTVFRTTGTAVGANHNSILRNFRVVPTGTNANLNAVVEIAYFDHELNGLPEEMMSFYTSNDGSNWKLRTEQHEKSGNLVTITGEQSLQQLYTLGSIISPLPVELMYFNAVRSGPDAVLTWATASEQDSKGFAVEVSTDGYTYRQLGFVKSGNGNSALTQRYTYKDTENGKTGMRYYRLRQVDENGDEKIYSPKAVNFGFVESAGITAYPNPFSTELTLSVATPEAGMARINIYDTVGKLLVSGEQRVQAGTMLIPLKVDALTQTGMYVVTVELNGAVHRLKVLKR